MTSMKTHFWAMISGAVFGGGLIASGMTDPNKVKGFFGFLRQLGSDADVRVGNRCWHLICGSENRSTNVKNETEASVCLVRA